METKKLSDRVLSNTTSLKVEGLPKWEITKFGAKGFMYQLDNSENLPSKWDHFPLNISIPGENPKEPDWVMANVQAWRGDKIAFSLEWNGKVPNNLVSRLFQYENDLFKSVITNNITSIKAILENSTSLLENLEFKLKKGWISVSYGELKNYLQIPLFSILESQRMHCQIRNGILNKEIYTLASSFNHDVWNLLCEGIWGLEVETWGDDGYALDMVIFKKFKEAFVGRLEKLRKICDSSLKEIESWDTPSIVNLSSILKEISLFNNLPDKDIETIEGSENFDSNNINFQVWVYDLIRVIENLIQNSKRSTVQKSLKEWSSNYTPSIKLKHGFENWSYVFKIIDNGEGIPEEIRDRILRENVSTKEEDWREHGVGLLNSKTILRKYNWKIKFDSNSEVTIFTIEIPFLSN